MNNPQRLELPISWTNFSMLPKMFAPLKFDYMKNSTHVTNKWKTKQLAPSSLMRCLSQTTPTKHNNKTSMTEHEQTLQRTATLLLTKMFTLTDMHFIIGPLILMFNRILTLAIMDNSYTEILSWLSYTYKKRTMMVLYRSPAQTDLHTCPSSLL